VNDQNPFFFSASPYECNPFRLLDVRPADAQATIEAAARSREHQLQRGVNPVPALDVTPGDFNRAAFALQDPLVRLAFDILAHCTEE
jgi:hypothetical protein